MPVTILVGAQWGDEGKGKVTDWLADERVDIIARYNGGDNAGHTLNVDGVTYKLHFIPSGILREGVMSLMGGGMVIHPERLLNEMNGLKEKGIDVSPIRLKLSSNAHVITPAHQALEKAAEAARGAGKLGTTGRGIGPAYTSKAERSGIRASLMRHPEDFGEAVYKMIEAANKTLHSVYHAETLDPVKIAAHYTKLATELKDYLVDGWAYVNHALKEGKRILAEGGQATLLDLDHGNYPFVTSSNPTVGGALVGLGFGPTHVDRVIGVTKAFTTRVGSGPFPTEEDNEIGAIMRGDGSHDYDDYGTTTGRPRRCGWLDLVVLKYAVAINGLTELAMMKLDILSRFHEVKVCTAYEIDGKYVEDYPVDQMAFQQAKPIYKTLSGWQVDIMDVTRFEDLPEQAQQYVEWVETKLDVKIPLVSVGPGREQTLIR